MNNRFIKRLACLVMALMLMLCAVGIAEDKPIEIVFWHSATADALDALNLYVDLFNETEGLALGVHVKAVYQGSYADSVNKMNGILSAGNYDDLPDVMQLDATGKLRYLNAAPAYTAEQALIEHEDYDASDFLAPALTNWRLNDTLLGLPFATSTTLTYYNKSVLDEAPDTLAGLDDLMDLYEIDSGASLYACQPNTPLLANWLGQIDAWLVDNYNGSEATATRLDCIDDGSLEYFLSVWKQLYDSGALTNRASSTDEFIAGRQLIMTASSSMISQLSGRIGDNFELGIAPFLRVDEDAAYGATVSGSCLVMFDRGDDEREAAWEFVKYMTSDEVQAGFAMATGYIPSRSSAVETDIWQSFIAENPAYNVGFEQLALTPATMRSVTVGPAADFYYGIQDAVSEMLTEDLNPAEAVELMQDELNGLLERYLEANG